MMTPIDIDRTFCKAADDAVVFFHMLGIVRLVQLAIVGILWSAAIFLKFAESGRLGYALPLLIGWLIFLVIHAQSHSSALAHNSRIALWRSRPLSSFFRLTFAGLGMMSLITTIFEWEGLTYNYYSIFEHLMFVLWVYYVDTFAPEDPPGKFFWKTASSKPS